MNKILLDKRLKIIPEPKLLIGLNLNISHKQKFQAKSSLDATHRKLCITFFVKEETCCSIYGRLFSDST